MVNFDKLWEIADRYNTSKPVSGNWDTETEHELNAISKELGISKQEAKDLMIKELGFDNDMFNGINCSLDKVEPVTPPRSIPHELPPHNNELVKQEKKTDKDGKSFKDYLDEARKNANSSRKIKSSKATTRSLDDLLNDNEFLVDWANKYEKYYYMAKTPTMTELRNFLARTMNKYNLNFDELKELRRKASEINSSRKPIKSGTNNFGFNSKVYGYDFPLVGFVVENEDENDPEGIMTQEAVEQAKELADQMDVGLYENYNEPSLSGEPFLIEFKPGYYEGVCIEVKEGQADVYDEEKEDYVPMSDAEMNTYAGKINSYFRTLREQYGWDNFVTDGAGSHRVSSSHKITSARYIATDPESGEVLGSADTYEEAVNEWGEDVTITDSEVGEGQGEENMDTGLFSSYDTECAYRDGREAFFDGKTLDNKPITLSKESSDAWTEGWKSAAHGEENGFTGEKAKMVESSKTPNGDKAFLSNIVSSVSTNNMTEEQAIKRIALRNNCNEGFARNILSEALNDETLISSGVMEIADDINKEFDIDGNIDSWLKAYMKDEGKSNTVGGEILRAFAKIRYRYYNDGDMIGRGYGKETVNPAARYLYEHVLDSSTADIEEMLNGESDINSSHETYEDWLEGYEGSLENYLRNNEELFHTPNKEDMLDYRTEEDKDSSVTECYIEDDEGNTYWFENDGSGDWKCYQIDSGSDKEFEVGDVVDSSQLEQYVDFADEDDYLDFDLNGLSYSAERTDGDSWEITNIDVDGGAASEGDYWSVDDLLRYDVYDSQGNSLSENDLY